jgi:hypothetical protein
LRVINDLRSCDSFFEWVPAFTPKEHADMLHTKMLRKEIEERRQKDEEFRAEIRRQDQEREERVRKEDQDHAERVRKEDQKRDDRIRKEDLDRDAKSKRSAKRLKKTEMEMKTAEMQMKTAELELKKTERRERWIQWVVTFALSAAGFYIGYQSQKGPSGKLDHTDSNVIQPSPTTQASGEVPKSTPPEKK